MTNMTERVARLLCVFQGRDPDELCHGELKAAGMTWLGWQAFATQAQHFWVARRAMERRNGAARGCR